MNTFLYNIILTIGTILVLLAISIVSLGYLWNLAKPTIESVELRYIKDNNVTLE